MWETKNRAPSTKQQNKKAIVDKWKAYDLRQMPTTKVGTHQAQFTSSFICKLLILHTARHNCWIPILDMHRRPDMERN